MFEVERYRPFRRGGGYENDLLISTPYTVKLRSVNFRLIEL